MLGVAVFVFAYYTAWTFVVPFLDELHFLNAYFPPLEWAIRIPVVLLVLGSLAVGTFVGNVLLKNAAKEKAKAKSKKLA